MDRLSATPYSFSSSTPSTSPPVTVYPLNATAANATSTASQILNSSYASFGSPAIEMELKQPESDADSYAVVSRLDQSSDTDDTEEPLDPMLQEMASAAISMALKMLSNLPTPPPQLKRLMAATAAKSIQETHLISLLRAETAKDTSAYKAIDAYFEAVRKLSAEKQAAELIALERVEGQLTAAFTSLAIFLGITPLKQRSQWLPWLMQHLKSSFNSADSSATPLKKLRMAYFAAHTNFIIPISFKSLIKNIDKLAASVAGDRLKEPSEALSLSPSEKFSQKFQLMTQQVQIEVLAIGASPAYQRVLDIQRQGLKWLQGDTEESTNMVANCSENMQTMLASIQEAPPAPKVMKQRLALQLRLNRRITLRLMEEFSPAGPRLSRGVVRMWRLGDRLAQGFVPESWLPRISIRYNIQPHVEELPDGSMHLDLTEQRVVPYQSKSSADKHK